MSQRELLLVLLKLVLLIIPENGLLTEVVVFLISMIDRSCLHRSRCFDPAVLLRTVVAVPLRHRLMLWLRWLLLSKVVHA